MLYNLYYIFRYDLFNFILKATNENIAMVTLHVENITWLGKPYSTCVREPDYGFAYTKQNCMLECEGKKVHPKKGILISYFGTCFDIFELKSTENDVFFSSSQAEIKFSNLPHW